MRLRSGWVPLLFSIPLVACAAEVPAGRGVALRDPLGLIDDVYASGNSLRLYVLPGGEFSCDATTGAVTPEPPDSPDAFASAIVDVSLTRGDLTNYEVGVPPGAQVVFVRGKGTDPVSGEMNRVIARGCGTAEVAEGATQSVTVVLAPVVSMGTCGNSLVSPDEQCETTQPECGPDCRTRPEAINTTTPSPQARPRVSSRGGSRVIAVWESDASRVDVRLLDGNARALTGLGPLAADRPLDDIGGALPGLQTTGAAAIAPDGRIAIAFTDFGGTAPPNVRVGFFSDTLVQSGSYTDVRADNTGMQSNAAVAFHSSNALMVAFTDAQSSTGLSGRIFAAGSTTPAGSEAFAVGAGQTGASAPVIAATSTGFVVAFAAGGNVFFQRFDAAGAPADAMAVAVDAPGTSRDQPALAALADGTFLVAWAEPNTAGDGMGQGVRARVFGPDGTPVAASFLVNSTIAGDQTRPAAAAAGSRFLVAFQSDASVRARVFSSAGDPSLNRESPPTLGDFQVAPTGAMPAVTVIGSGADQAWWIAWEGPGDATDIFARRFPL